MTLAGRVSPFGHPRISACLPAPLGFSQVNDVLHRLSTPRHPPCALRPVIIPTRHRRIGTSLSQAMLMSQLVRLTLHNVVCHSELVIYAFTTCPRGGLWILCPRKLVLRGEGESTGKSSRIMQLSKSSWLPFSRYRDATLFAEVQSKRRAENLSRISKPVNALKALNTLFLNFFFRMFSGVISLNPMSSRTFQSNSADFQPETKAARLSPGGSKIFVGQRLTCRADHHLSFPQSHRSQCLRPHYRLVVGSQNLVRNLQNQALPMHQPH